MDCDSPIDDVSAPGTRIISPNYPRNYDSGKDCQITINLSERVRISFEAFDIESHSSCTKDYIQVREGDSANSKSISPKLCGNTIPDAIESSNKSMTLIFHTDGSGVQSGFKILVEQIGKKEF